MRFQPSGYGETTTPAPLHPIGVTPKGSTWSPGSLLWTAQMAAMPVAFGVSYATNRSFGWALLQGWFGLTYLSYRAALHVMGKPAKQNRGSWKPLPKNLPKTSRKRASAISALGPKGKVGGHTRWPIGDLYHAKLAAQYMKMGRGKRTDYPTVLRALKKHYPEYKW